MKRMGARLARAAAVTRPRALVCVRACVCARVSKVRDPGHELCGRTWCRTRRSYAPAKASASVQLGAIHAGAADSTDSTRTSLRGPPMAVKSHLGRVYSAVACATAPKGFSHTGSDGVRSAAALVHICAGTGPTPPTSAPGLTVC